jgi:flagellar FliL protein
MRIIILCLSFFLFSTVAYAGDDVEEKIEYLEMGSRFTVNLDTPKHYLAISVQLMVEGDKNIEKIKKVMPALRHELIMAYTGRTLNDLQTMEQREALRKETKSTIIEALEKHSNSDGLRDVFFTEFLVN